MLNRKIIIVINNYEMDNRFAEYGVQLAKRLDRPALLTGVARIPRTVDSTGLTAHNLPRYTVTDIEAIQKDREAALQKIYMEAKVHYENMDYEVEIGFPEATILNKTEEDNPFMVVVEGNHELSKLSEWFGTYETRIAEHAEAPVLVVPKDYIWKPVQDILYVMELEDDSKARNIRRLYEMATAFNANLHIMLVADDATETVTEKYKHIIETMQTLYDYKAVQYSLVTNIGSAREIEQMTSRMLVDWLAIEHGKESFITRIFSDLNSDRLILQAKIPILVF